MPRPTCLSCFFFFRFFCYFIFGLKNWLKKIIEPNWVQESGRKFNRLIHNIWTIIFFLFLFNAFFVPQLKKNTISSFVINYLFFLFNLNLKEYKFIICYLWCTITISTSHAYHSFFTSRKNILYKKIIMRFIKLSCALLSYNEIKIIFRINFFLLILITCITCITSLLDWLEFI
jgi:hypothetical protein